MSDPIKGQVRPARGANLPHAQPSPSAPSARGPHGPPSTTTDKVRRLTDGARIDPDALQRFLRRRHHFDTAEQVAAATGIPAETVRNWLRLRARPSIGNFLSLALHYGPDIVAAAWPGAPRWLSAACRDEERARLEAEQERINRRLEDLRG